MGEAKRKQRWARAQGKLEWVVKDKPKLVILAAGDPNNEIHLMPARRAPDFEDPHTARDYMVQVQKAGDPVLKFGPAGAEHLYVHWGHIAEASCPCQPRYERRAEEVIYTHNLEN